MVRLKEPTYFFLVGVILLFLTINFDIFMGLIFMGMGLWMYVLYDLDKRRTIIIERKPNKGFSLLLGIGGALGTIAFAAFTMPIFIKGTQVLGLNSVIGLMSNFEPIFEGNAYFQVLAYGFMIPIIETPFFFGRLFETLTDGLKSSFPNVQKLNLTNKAFWLFSIIISTIFMLFHLTAKVGAAGTGGGEALYVVWVFAMVSMIVIALEKQLLGAMIMHIILNSVFMIKNLGLELTGLVLVIPIASIGLLFFLFSRNPNKIKNIIGG